MKQFPCAFPYNKNYVDALEVTLSAGRLHLYRKYADNDDVEALKLYCWNTCLSQVFYWPLHAFEVSLRNAMADRMYDEYGDDWYERIDSFKRGRGNNEEVEHVDKAKRKLDQDGLAYGHDNIVAAISMGFWEGLLKVEYEEKLWKPLFSAIFPIDRSEAFRKVNQMKRLRNNVAHHEPVFVFLPKGDKRLLYEYDQHAASAQIASFLQEGINIVRVMNVGLHPGRYGCNQSFQRTAKETVVVLIVVGCTDHFYSPDRRILST